MKAYLELVKSTYMRGTSLRNTSKTYVEYALESDTSDAIRQLLSTLDDNILVGCEYDNGMFDTNKYEEHYYTRNIFVETEDSSGLYKHYLLEYNPCYPDGVLINRLALCRDVYKPLISQISNEICGFTCIR